MRSRPEGSRSRRWKPELRQKSGMPYLLTSGKGYGETWVSLYPLCRGENQSRMGRDVLLQELHLVRQDAPIGQDQIFGLVRDVGRVEQLHAGLFRQAIPLVPVAVPAGAHHAHPRFPPPAP